MQNIGTTIVVIALLGILIFIVPMVTLTDRVDNVTQENADLIVKEFVTDLTSTGILTRAKYQEFESELVATGNVYDIEIEIQHLDENQGKKTAQANYTKIGENVYYSEYTTQILKQLGIKVDNESVALDNDRIILKEGDFVVVKVTNQNPTTAQTLKSSFLNFSNSNENIITSQDSGMVTVNGVK